jgi:hypothetical protein
MIGFLAFGEQVAYNYCHWITSQSLVTFIWTMEMLNYPDFTKEASIHDGEIF